MKRFLLYALFIPFIGFAQAPAGYYDAAASLNGYALKTKLSEIISTKYISWHYGDLQQMYNLTDLDRYYDHGAENQTYLLDIYSEIPNGPDNYEYTSSQMIGSANAEGLGWNREHMMPQSTFYSNYPMYSDLFFVIPTDARINQLRSNYPYGMAGSPNYYTFSNGSKISRNSTPGSGYTGRVYEPIDEFKGDIARSLLYFAVRYEAKLSSFNYFTGTTAANDMSPLDGTNERAFENWYLALLLQWHEQDPVSQREIDRNNAVFSLQKNRNPFIDHPEWVRQIWNQTPDAVAPGAPMNLTANKVSAYFVNLSWDSPADNDVLGFKIYQNGTLITTTKDRNVIIDRLSPSTTYNFTVKTYDTGYLESAESLVLPVTTIDHDVFAKDLMITKYLEGSDTNSALEITNKTGHTVNLNRYRLSIQFYNSTNANYYFPAPYELEGVIAHNETLVILNPYAKFTCITNDDARFVTAAPQLTFTGSQYLELRYQSTTVDAIGFKNTDNYTALANKSLYRNTAVNHPNDTFTSTEWQEYPLDFCENLGVLAASPITPIKTRYKVYPNPVEDVITIEGDHLKRIRQAVIYDASGKMIRQINQPFTSKNTLNIENLAPGIYLLQINDVTLKFIKK